MINSKHILNTYILFAQTYLSENFGLLWYYYMILVMRKPVFGVCNQLRLKLVCAATEASQWLEISDIETRDTILSRRRTTKVQIRLHRCAGWSASLLFAYGINTYLMPWLILQQNQNLFDKQAHLHVKCNWAGCTWKLLFCLQVNSFR